MANLTFQIRQENFTWNTKLDIQTMMSRICCNFFLLSVFMNEYEFIRNVAWNSIMIVNLSGFIELPVTTVSMSRYTFDFSWFQQWPSMMHIIIRWIHIVPLGAVGSYFIMVFMNLNRSIQVQNLDIKASSRYTLQSSPEGLLSGESVIILALQNESCHNDNFIDTSGTVLLSWWQSTVLTLLAGLRLFSGVPSK